MSNFKERGHPWVALYQFTTFLKKISAWQWAGWPETWDYSQSRGGPLVPWFGANNWGHQLSNSRGNPANNAYSQAYGNSWGTGNGAISGGGLHGYGGAASVGTASSHRTGGNRKGYSQR